jgi:hypothetical protein
MLGLKESKNRGGRPRLRQPQPGERVPLGLRVTPATKELVDRTARDSGRSLSAEVEVRLEHSFRDEASFMNALDNINGPINTGLMLFLGRIIYAADAVSTVDNSNCETWLDSPVAFDNVVRVVNDLFKSLRPESTGRPIKRSKVYDDIIRSPLTALATHRSFEPIRERLGDYCARISK